MPPKRSLSPNSAAAHLAEAKRQALEEQRQRAEEWAKKFIKSPAPTPSATPSKKGRASVEADSHPFTEDVVEETPTRSRKRLSSKLPVSAESVGREKRPKNEEEVQKDDEQMSESEWSTQRKSARARKSISANMPAIDEDAESDARVRSSSPHRPLTESSSDIGSAVSTPRRRRPFAIPEESLNAALNPPKLTSATKKTVVPQSPAEASQTIHVPTSSQRRRQTLSSLPRDEDPVSSPAENSRATSSRRSSFASLTGSRGLSSLPETIKEETESAAQEIRSPISQQKDGARVSSESTVVATSSVPAAKDTMENRPQMPDSLTATVNNQDVGVEEQPSTVEIISKESQDTDSSTWDFLTPYLWIIIYIQLLIIVAVALYFADTRLVGITTVVVSLGRRLFLYLV